jgi:acyl carrier protein
MDIRQRLKQVIVEDLNLEETTPEQIRDDEVLFGEGIAWIRWMPSSWWS